MLMTTAAANPNAMTTLIVVAKAMVAAVKIAISKTKRAGSFRRYGDLGATKALQISVEASGVPRPSTHPRIATSLTRKPQTMSAAIVHNSRVNRAAAFTGSSKDMPESYRDPTGQYGQKARPQPDTKCE